MEQIINDKLAALKEVRLVAIGVGNSGSNIINYMMNDKPSGLEFIISNTHTKESLRETIEGADIVFVVTGFGGTKGTINAPLVASNDGSLEEEYVYDKISEIVKVNKPIVIILNNKRGIRLNSKEAIEEINKVNVNLSKIGDRNGINRIENQVKLCMVDAKTALEGKVDNENELIIDSNILHLEKIIEEVLEKSGTTEVINALNNYIQKFIDAVIDRIDNKIDLKEVQKIEELITYLEKYKQSSDVKLKNIISKKTPIFADNLITKLLNTDTTENGLNDYIEEMIQDIIQEIEYEVHNIENSLETRCEEFIKEFIEINPEYEHFDTFSQNNETKEPSPFLEDLKDKTSDVFKNKDFLKSSAETILSNAKRYLPKKVMYGKGPVWIGKAAGKVAVALTVIMSVNDIYSAHAEHEKAVQRERERTLSAKDSAQSISDGIKACLFVNIDEIVSVLFDNLIINYKRASRELSNGNESLIVNKDGLLGVLNRL